MAETGRTPAMRLPLVLIVDDTPSNVQLLALALKRDYAIRTAASGDEALAALAAPVKPDLILLDIMMPGMDGYEVCRRIKLDPDSRNIPVIFISAMDQAEDQKRGFAAGAVDYITKPFEVPLVRARINVHVRLKLKSEMLEKLAFLDGLTDIPNRRALEEALAREWGRAKRSATPLSLLMLDIDHFKAYNDRCGHGAGDTCLRLVARELEQGLMRPGDFVGRYGGEEFCVILPDCDSAGAAQVAEKLCERIAALRLPHPNSPVADHVTVSIGYTTQVAAPDAPLSQLMEAADTALYMAKSRGRNRTCGHEGGC